jgi:hypothetical protein
MYVLYVLYVLYVHIDDDYRSHMSLSVDVYIGPSTKYDVVLAFPCLLAPHRDHHTGL